MRKRISYAKSKRNEDSSDDDDSDAGSGQEADGRDGQHGEEGDDDDEDYGDAHELAFPPSTSRGEQEIFLNDQVIHNVRMRPQNRQESANSMRTYNFLPMGQQWDYQHPCTHCGCVWLKANVRQYRRGCCKDGAWVRQAENSSDDKNDDSA